MAANAKKQSDLGKEMNNSRGRLQSESRLTGFITSH